MKKNYYAIALLAGFLVANSALADHKTRTIYNQTKTPVQVTIFYKVQTKDGKKVMKKSGPTTINVGSGFFGRRSHETFNLKHPKVPNEKTFLGIKKVEITPISGTATSRTHVLKGPHTKELRGEKTRAPEAVTFKKSRKKMFENGNATITHDEKTGRLSFNPGKPSDSKKPMNKPTKPVATTKPIYNKE